MFVAANMTGTEKRPLFVIGKSAKPQCFKNVKCLPVRYVANKKAWMTTVLYKKMLREWNKELRKGNRKILLLVDNCPSHSSITLDCIRVEFLPPNTTSVLQPMDMGVIKCLKGQYPKLLAMKILKNIEHNVLQTNITVLDAIIMLKKGWDAVSTSTIANCFIHADLSDRVVTSPGEDVFSDLQSMLPLVVMSSNSITPNEYIDIDKDIHTSEVLSDTEIVTMIVNEEKDDVNELNLMYLIPLLPILWMLALLCKLYKHFVW